MILLLIILILIAIVVVFMRRPQFGKPAIGERLGRIERSKNYRGGQFQNLHHTPSLAEGESYTSVMRKFIFGKDKRATPPSTLPSQKTHLLHLDPKRNVIVWFGHSSYFLQIDGKRMLIDPVLSGNASPVSFTTKSYAGSDIYTTDDLPPIDYLFISHDHWDHLDHRTVTALKQKVGKVITGLGVGAHLEHWGYDTDCIIEKDWNEEVVLDNGFTVYTAPARHFSGRTFKRNRSLWLSFVLQTPTKKIYLGGDSGYDDHFAAIGSQYGPFDLAILENGQYDPSWRYIHMMPEEVVQAGIDLQAKMILPVHWAKFTLGNHAWDDPIIRVLRAGTEKNIPILHPMIGETLDLDRVQTFIRWWEQVQ